MKAEPIPFKPEGPQPLLREVPKGKPYPVEALGPLSEAVQAVQGMTLAPIAIPAASALAVASLAVQGHVDVETLGGTRPVSLYLMTVAQSGERKSSCDAPLMAELREFEKAEANARRNDLAAWQNRYALWKGDRDRILAEARKTKGEKRIGSEADLHALGREPCAPPSPDRTVTEPTFEGLTRKFAEGMPTLGIFSDEGGQFLGGFAMTSENKQKTLAALNDLWQGNPIRRTRAGDGSFTLYGRRLAMHLMAQCGVAHAFMSDPMAADTGFLPRFLISEPQSTIGTRLQSAVRHESAALAKFNTRLREILDTPLPMDAETRELQPRVIPLSAEARALLVSFADGVELQQGPDGAYAHVRGHASKAAEHAARIAGVLTSWGDLRASEVSGQTMAQGIALADFYLGEAARVANAATVSAEIDRAERLRRWICETWPEVDVLPSEILRHAPIRALREAPSAKAAISVLEHHGWLVKLPAGTVVRGACRKAAYRIVRSGNE